MIFLIVMGAGVGIGCLLVWLIPDREKVSR
jgi:hypothetical protein